MILRNLPEGEVATSIWKGMISFGLVSVPVRLFSATQSNNISFNLLHEECGNRINLQNFCGTCEKVVTRDELIKGYEHAKNEYVHVTDEEIDQIKPQSSSTLEITQFIQISEVDPIFFEKSYYLGPESGSEKVFALLTKAMSAKGKAAIGQLTMRNHEYLVLFRPDHDGTGLILHFMLYESEVRQNENLVGDNFNFRDKEIDLAEQLIENLTEPFDASQYKDNYVDRVQELIDSKIEGRSLRIVKPKAPPKVKDLMDALQKSVERTRKPMAMQETSVRKGRRSAM
jgi:DNA end-binding protein Ku